MERKRNHRQKKLIKLFPSSQKIELKKKIKSLKPSREGWRGTQVTYKMSKRKFSFIFHLCSEEEIDGIF